MQTNEKDNKIKSSKQHETGESYPELKIYGPINLIDDELPDIIGRLNHTPLTLKRNSITEMQCNAANKVDWGQYTSTWLSVSDKNFDMRNYIPRIIDILPDGAQHRDLDEEDDETDEKTDNLPYCDNVPTSLRIPDHLEGVKMRHNLHLSSEWGLQKTLLGKIAVKYIKCIRYFITLILKL